MNKTEIRNLLSQLGLTGVVTTKGLAEFLGLAPQNIDAAKNAGKLHLFRYQQHCELVI